MAALVLPAGTDRSYLIKESAGVCPGMETGMESEANNALAPMTVTCN